MSLDSDVEKEGRHASIASDGHEDDAVSFGSRARSYSGDMWRKSSVHPYKSDGTESIRSRWRDHSTGPDQEQALGDFFHRFQSPVDSREQVHNSNSTRSHNFTTEDIQHQPPPRVSDGGQASLPRNRQGSMYLDRNAPGDWVISHHLSNLITRLDEYESTASGSRLSSLSAKIRNMCRSMRPEPKPLPAPASSSHGDGMRFRISFAEVQRMRIRKLQCQLVRHVVKMRFEGRESADWEETLEQYIKAVQDHDYMQSRSKSDRDPFLATGEYAVDNYVLNCNIDKILANDISIHVDSLKPWDVASDESNDPITGTRGSNVAKTWYRGFRERLLIAATGGAFLVGPMWIMVLKGGLYTSLISTTAFVAAFGVLMAYFLNEAKDVLASTAAYAAVLVVFVGTNNP